MGSELANLGVGHFRLYLQHDAQDATPAAFGTEVIPSVGEQLLARSGTHARAVICLETVSESDRERA